eukprot:106403_1
MSKRNRSSQRNDFNSSNKPKHYTNEPFVHNHAIQTQKLLNDTNTTNITSQSLKDDLPPKRKESRFIKLLAGPDVVLRALSILSNFSKYDDDMITQALRDLESIEENTQFILAKGGLNYLMDLINYKCKKKDLSPEQVAVVANSTRLMGSLLSNPKLVGSFEHKSGLNILKNMMEYYYHEETIINATVDAIGNITGTQSGKQLLIQHGVVETATNVICKHPEYIHLLSDLPLTTNPKILKQLLNVELLS